MRVRGRFPRPGALAGWACALGLLLAAGSAAHGAEEALDRKATLIARLLHPPPSPWTPDLRTLLGMMADVPLRRLFLGLRSDAAWGPAHRQWQRRYPEFRAGYLALVSGELAALEVRLAGELAEAMSEAELTELVGAAEAPEFRRLLGQASRLGLDLGVAVRTTNLAAAPELYGPEEIEQVRAELSKWLGKDLEMQSLALGMQAVARRYEQPVFVRYQSTLHDALLPIASATLADPGFRARFDAWLASWRDEPERLGF